jgi:hypothetical protein
MTNVWTTREKVDLRERLFKIGVQTLEKEGWTVERIPKSGKSSLRRILKGGKSLKVSIRTTQDTYIAFPRTQDDKSWVTLSAVDAVIAVSVDDRENPQFALVHMLDGKDMRDRFDRTYAARRTANHRIPVGRGVWLSLYLDESTSPPHLVGAGAGNVYPPIAKVPLKPEEARAIVEHLEGNDSDRPLTIAQAKIRLARGLGVEPSSIKITVEA